ncbi:unnamed protein product [Pedinophyceae sp. YPF-701]|nr:unnamed protein product [Pedinophyceae sp. YPF-701]
MGTKYEHLLPDVKVEYRSEKCSERLDGRALDRLGPGSWVGDTVVNFFALLLQRELLSPEQQRAVYIYNSWFLPKLSLREIREQAPERDVAEQLGRSHSGEKGAVPFGGGEWAAYFEQAYGGVKKWTGGVDIFRKRYLLMPWFKDSHFALIVVCFPAHFAVRPAQDQGAEPTQPPDAGGKELTLLYIDSLAGRDVPQHIGRWVQGYLRFAWDESAKTQGSYACEWTEQQRGQGPAANSPIFTHGSLYDMERRRCPAQPNGVDCGLYMLANMAMFGMTCPDDLSPPYPAFLTERWYPNELVAGLRALLFQDVALRLHAETARMRSDSDAMEAKCLEIREALCDGIEEALRCALKQTSPARWRKLPMRGDAQDRALQFRAYFADEIARLQGSGS